MQIFLKPESSKLLIKYAIRLAKRYRYMDVTSLSYGLLCQATHTGHISSISADVANKIGQ